MSERTVVALANSASDIGPTHVIIWIANVSNLRQAQAALRSLQKIHPDAEEVVFKESDAFGVKASFGQLDTESLGEAEPEAVATLEDDHYADLADPSAPVADLLEDVEEDFGSVRIHVQDDCFYVTANFDEGDSQMESEPIPFAAENPFQG